MKSIFKKDAVDILIMIGDKQGECPSYYFGHDRTRFLRFRDMMNEGFIRLEDDVHNIHTATAYLTERGLELYRTLKSISETCGYKDSEPEVGKIITFYAIEPSEPIPDMIHGYRRTEYEINSGTSTICTTQMALLSTDLFEKGYRVFVSDQRGMYEITLGTNERTQREIRISHNLFKLWRGGEFD